jgi:hypothetical protein
LPAGTDVVIRVTPAAASLGRRELAATLDRLLVRTTTAGAA